METHSGPRPVPRPYTPSPPRQFPPSIFQSVDTSRAGPSTVRRPPSPPPYHRSSSYSPYGRERSYSPSSSPSYDRYQSPPGRAYSTTSRDPHLDGHANVQTTAHNFTSDIRSPSPAGGPSSHEDSGRAQATSSTGPSRTQKERFSFQPYTAPRNPGVGGVAVLRKPNTDRVPPSIKAPAAATTAAPAPKAKGKAKAPNPPPPTFDRDWIPIGSRIDQRLAERYARGELIKKESSNIKVPLEEARRAYIVSLSDEQQAHLAAHRQLPSDAPPMPLWMVKEMNDLLSGTGYYRPSATNATKAVNGKAYWMTVLGWTEGSSAAGSKGKKGAAASAGGAGAETGSGGADIEMADGARLVAQDSHGHSPTKAGLAQKGKAERSFEKVMGFHSDAELWEPVKSPEPFLFLNPKQRAAIRNALVTMGVVKKKPQEHMFNEEILKVLQVVVGKNFGIEQAAQKEFTELERRMASIGVLAAITGIGPEGEQIVARPPQKAPPPHMILRELQELEKQTVAASTSSAVEAAPAPQQLPSGKAGGDAKADVKADAKPTVASSSGKYLAPGRGTLKSENEVNLRGWKNASSQGDMKARYMKLMGCYNWKADQEVESKSWGFIIPGAPPLWDPPAFPMDTALNPDSERTRNGQNQAMFVNQNSAKTKHPMLPLFACVEICQSMIGVSIGEPHKQTAPSFGGVKPRSEDTFSFADCDVITDRNNLRKLFDFVQKTSNRSSSSRSPSPKPPAKAGDKKGGKVVWEESFRIDVELVQEKTLVLIRREPVDVYRDNSGGFGHSFEDAVTSGPDIVDSRGNAVETSGYHVVQQCDIGGRKFMVRCEVDAVMAAELLEGASISNGDVVLADGKPIVPRYELEADGIVEYSLTVYPAGEFPPTSTSLAEIKSQSAHAHDRVQQKLPQLFFGGVEYLIRGKHDNGVFREQPKITRTSELFPSFLSQKSGTIKGIVNVLDEVRVEMGKKKWTYARLMDLNGELVLRHMGGGRMEPERMLPLAAYPRFFP